MKTAVLLLAILAPLAGLDFWLAARQAMAQDEAGQGFFRTKAGSLEVVALLDAQSNMAFSLLNGISQEDLSVVAAKAGLPEGAAGFPGWVNAFAVYTPQGVVLLDAGNGPDARLPQSLKEAGIDPDDVKAVLLTHFHGDHIGGLVYNDGRMRFPNATVYADAKEDRWWLEGGRSERARSILAPYKEAGRYKTVNPGDEVLPGVKVVELYGHTPGHVGFLFETGAEPLLVWGDIVHVRLVQFDRPEVSLSFDTDPAAAVAARQRIFAEAAEKGYLVAGVHLPFPGLGRLAKGEGSAYEYLPVEGSGD